MNPINHQTAEKMLAQSAGEVVGGATNNGQRTKQQTKNERIKTAGEKEKNRREERVSEFRGTNRWIAPILQ